MIDLTPLPMQEAIDFWASKVLMRPAQFRRLSAELKVRAFAVSGIAKGAEINGIYQALQKSITKGTTYEQFKDDIADTIARRGWTGPKAWRVDNIFRTNIQTAYSVGRYKQMQEATATRPYWKYSAINDSRTRPTHLAQHGKIYPHDHKFWDTWFPPNGFRCRCGVTSLSADDIEARGLKVETDDPTGKLIEPIQPGTGVKLPARLMMPDRGFDFHPGKAAWQLDVELYEQAQKLTPAIRDLFLEKMATSGLRGEAFAAWVDEAIESGVKRGETMVVGWLHPKVLHALEDASIDPETAAIIINDKRVTHALSAAKTGRDAALDVAEFKRLPDTISAPEAVLLEKERGTLLYVSAAGELKNKTIVTIDYQSKKHGKVNFVLTAGKDTTANLQREKYEVIWGELL